MSRLKSDAEVDRGRWVVFRDQCLSCDMERLTTTSYPSEETFYKNHGCLYSNRKECPYHAETK